MSDGSSAVLYVHPQSFKVKGCIFVFDNVGPVGFLNALEYADGKLYANVHAEDAFREDYAPRAGSDFE